MAADLLVVGTGLIGTSLGLALQGRARVLLTDADPATLAAAVDRGAGEPWDGSEAVTTAVVCTPPGVVAGEVARLQALGVSRTQTHVSSVQAAVQAGLEAQGCDPASVCGSHPMAGRERSGPGAATGTLFAGRPWVLCPGPATRAQALSDVEELVAASGATPVRLGPDDHDAAVALVSHLPQLAASALAAQLAGGGRDAAALAGPGLQDSTRIAGSDPRLWREVLRLNAANVAPLLAGLARDLTAAADALGRVAADAADADALDDVVEVLRRGVAGRALVPVKRGERDAAFVSVAVQVSDRPGQIAGLLVAAGQADVNVEDVRVDHVPGRPQGVIELAVRAPARAHLEAALRAGGWDVLSRE